VLLPLLPHQMDVCGCQCEEVSGLRGAANMSSYKFLWQGFAAVLLMVAVSQETNACRDGQSIITCSSVSGACLQDGQVSLDDSPMR